VPISAAEDINPFTEEIYGKNSSPPSPSAVHDCVALLCANVEDYLREFCPRATHYSFSTLMWKSTLHEKEVLAASLEAHIQAFCFRDLFQRKFPFVFDPPEQFPLFED